MELGIDNFRITGTVSPEDILAWNDAVNGAGDHSGPEAAERAMLDHVIEFYGASAVSRQRPTIEAEGRLRRAHGLAERPELRLATTVGHRLEVARIDYYHVHESVTALQGNTVLSLVHGDQSTTFNGGRFTTEFGVDPDELLERRTAEFEVDAWPERADTLTDLTNITGVGRLGLILAINDREPLPDRSDLRDFPMIWAPNQSFSIQPDGEGELGIHFWGTYPRVGSFVEM